LPLSLWKPLAACATFFDRKINIFQTGLRAVIFTFTLQLTLLARSFLCKEGVA